MTESGWSSWEGLEQKGVQKGGLWYWLLQETEIWLPSLWLSKPVGDFTVPTNILFGVWCFEGRASSKHLHWMVENWGGERGRGSHKRTSPRESDGDSSGHATDLAAAGLGSVSTGSGQRGTRIRDSTWNTHNLIGESQPAFKAKEPDRDRTQLDGELRGPWLLEGEREPWNTKKVSRTLDIPTKETRTFLKEEVNLMGA